MSRETFAECFLLVPTLETVRPFYEEALGLTVDASGAQSVTYDVAGTTLKLQADYPPEVFEEFNLSPPPESGRGRGAFLALEVPDPLPTVHERVEASAGAALTEPRTVSWLDGSMFLAADPMGYTVELR